MTTNERMYLINYYNRMIKDLKREKIESENDGTPHSVVEVITSDLAHYTDRLNSL